MKQGYIQITLAYSRELDLGKLLAFEVCADVYDVIPHGYFTFRDSDGRFFSQFYGLTVGCPVDIKVVSEPEDPMGKSKETFEYPTFYVTKVENDCSSDSSVFGGNIKVYFSHPWTLMKDVTNHAYEAMNGMELIRKVLEDETRGEAFTIDEDNFTKTDDPGSFSRYKVNETDYDFIMKKVLPYCCIDQNPAHLFCDETGAWWLRSFKELFKENAKIIIGPKPEDVALKDVGDAIQKSYDDNGLDEAQLFNTTKAYMQIGDDAINAEIYPSFVLENANSSGSAAGNKQPGNILKPHNGESFGNILPIDSQLMTRTGATKTKLILNRALLDAFTILFAGSDLLDHMFRLCVETEFVGQYGNIGDTAEVILPKVVYEDEGPKEKGKYKSWISGKWLITRIEHGTDKDNTRQLNSRVYLSRPSFVGNEKSTSLVDLAAYYEVP